ncbi:CCA tRNA nucleotidyltransferase [Paenibacillus sp. GCM10027626]|uniref:CCA tRNA nucleotidyltransferase n=1 Tax=Paenibacillus sp. GCM10027626 TaxID=3273411 RepID=UPI0036368FE3
MNIEQNAALRKALPILEQLQGNGFEAVFVGGCVRDTLLGRPIHDVDIATSAKPQEVMAVFPHFIPTGLQHGTVTIRLRNEYYEVTTYRTESEYEAHRRPSDVQFVSDLAEDLRRRDFTINAMALRMDGRVVDPFGGRSDLQRRVLRSVGDAGARFQEDALRMVRAVRFAANLSLRIEKRTWRAMIKHRSLLCYVAMERVGAEADKMMEGIAPQRALLLMLASGMLSNTKLPLLNEERLDELAGQRRVRVQWHKLAGLAQRWGALCLAYELTGAEAEQLAGALCFSNKRKQELRSAAAIGRRMSDAPLIRSNKDQLRHLWLSTILEHNKRVASDWLELTRSIPALQIGDELYEQLQVWLQAMPVSSIKELDVNGTELARNLHMPEGPWLGKLLAWLLQETAFGHIENNSAALLTAARKKISQEQA